MELMRLSKGDLSPLLQVERLPKRIEDTIDRTIPNLYKVGTENAVYLVTKQIVDAVNKYLKGNECELTPDDFITLSELICDEYPDIKINEPQLVIRRAAAGDFGPLYNKIDIPSIMQWVKSYYAKRADKHAEHKESEHRRAMNEHNELTPEMREYYAGIRNKWIKKWEEDDTERKRRIAQAQLKGKRPDPNDMRKIKEEDIK